MIIKIAKNLLALLFLSAVALVVVVACTAGNADKMMNDIENQVAIDSVEQYEIAKKQGDPIMTCVQAGMVSAAYLQAKDETKYNEWKSVERTDCEAAGISK